MRCARCDAELTGGTVTGLCPVCLIDTALPEQASPDNGAFRYDLIEEIGRGGMGVVYRAMQHGSLRQVAVKMILAEQAATPGMLERFRAEGEAIASLDHAHILPIYETGEIDGTPFYSMRLVSGGTLRECVADFRAQPRWAAKLMATVARAVHHAHERGILHRDLKPGNILLDGAERTPFVSDFGLAKWLGRNNRLTLATSALGTPHYIAPEQAAGASKELTPAADVYSLGAILYELLAGRPPFVADTPLETLRLAADTPPPAPRNFEAAIPRDLEVICLKCLAKEPSTRYRSAAALAEDLERWLEGRTILARPSTPVARAWRWTKRNRIIAALSVALGVALLTMVIAWVFVQRTPPRANMSGAPAKSIAVLPFENLSDQQNASFASGVQDEILTHLAKIADLKVISRTSVMSYTSGVQRNVREIGQQLGVGNLLEGSVQRSGNRIRVNAQLIDARSDSHLWAQTYDRDLADVFAIQTEIARAISDQLQAKLSPSEKAAIETPPTRDLVAFDLYSRAKTLLTGIDTSDIGKNNLLQAVELLEQAIGRDPTFVQAYCQLASTHDNLYSLFDHTSERLAFAETAIQRALQLAPDAGEVHLALARHFYQGREDFDRARAEIALAQKTLPNSPLCFLWDAYIDRRQGRWLESIRKFQRSVELDPRNRDIHTQLALTYQHTRHYLESSQALDRILSLVPNDQGSRVMKAGNDLLGRADTIPLHSAVDSILKEDPGATRQLADSWLYVALCERDFAGARRAIDALAGGPIRWNRVLLNHDFLEGLLARVSGDAAAAQAAFNAARVEQEKLVAAQPDYGPAICALGLIDSGLGRKEDALREGRRAIELLPVTKDSVNGALMIKLFALICAWVGENDVAFEQLAKAAQLPGHLHYGELQLHPVWDPLREDPRFDKIVAGLGAVTTSPASAVSEKSIAVLPFENLSRDPDSAYFAQGVQDEILTRLSKIADLKVISRTSTQHYKGAPENLPEIARQLGVAQILEGSVQKSGDAVRVNVQLIKAANDSHLWADTFDRKLTDIFSVESEVAKAIADQLRVKLTGQEEQVIAAKPTDNPEAYDAYLRGLAYTLKTGNTQANSLGAQRYLREAVRLDPKFALAWALLSDVDSRGYVTQALQPTLALREEARHAAETALTLQPNLGEALLAKGYYHYACLKDYDAAVRYFEQARQFLPNNSRIPQSLAYVARRRGQWDQSESYFKEAERLDPRNVNLLSSHAGSYIMLRRFPEALRKLEQVLNITPDDVDTIVLKAGIAQAEGDLPHASALLAPLRPSANLHHALQTQVYQAILERRPAEIIPRLKEILVQPDPALGFYNGELRFYLGWAQEVAGDQAAAQESWQQARNELEPFLREQPENYHLLGDLALTNMGLGDKAAALSLAERAMAVLPIEKDPMDGPWPMEILARVAARMGEPDRAITILQKLLSIPYEGPLSTTVVPLTPALLRLDPMFDPLRGDPRFQKLADKIVPQSISAAPLAPEKSIAVLPFLDLSPAKDQEYFCDGISEEILNTLAKVEGLQVAARTSSFSFEGTNLGVKEIAAKLGVRHILEGSIRRDGNRIRVTAQLVNASDGFHLWSETYEREVQGIFAVQDEITRAITDALKLKLAGVRPAQKQNTEAHDLYLQGVFFSNKSTEEGLRKALEFFQRSLEKDPNSARAWAGIAKTWNWLADAYVRPLEAYPQVVWAAEKAIALDPDNAEAHIWMGESKRILDWDMEGFKAELDRALQLDPNSATAHSFMGLSEATRGNKDAAVMHVRESLRLDPLSPIISNFAAVGYLCLGLLDEAIAEGKRTLQLDPNYIYETPILADAYREKGMFAEAIALFLKAQQITGAPQPALAITYASMGRTAEARQILAELKEVAAKKYIAAEEIAAVYTALGERDEAFKWLEQACADHGGAVHAVPIRPVFRSLHSDPRFRAIVRRIGIDPAKVLDREKKPVKR